MENRISKVTIPLPHPYLPVEPLPYARFKQLVVMLMTSLYFPHDNYHHTLIVFIELSACLIPSPLE